MWGEVAVLAVKFVIGALTVVIVGGGAGATAYACSTRCNRTQDSTHEKDSVKVVVRKHPDGTLETEVTMNTEDLAHKKHTGFATNTSKKHHEEAQSKHTPQVQYWPKPTTAGAGLGAGGALDDETKGSAPHSILAAPSANNGDTRASMVQAASELIAAEIKILFPDGIALQPTTVALNGVTVSTADDDVV